MSETVYLGLGSNLGDRESFLKKAVALLGAVDGLEVTALSAIYVGPAEEMADNSPAFLNQVIRTEYDFTPEELLRAVEKIESDLGRDGKGTYLARTIDIDLLLFGERCVITSVLEIPHPRMHKRPFVLVPLLEIDAALTHPKTGKHFSQYPAASSPSRLEVYKDYVARQV